MRMTQGVRGVVPNRMRRSWRTVAMFAVACMALAGACSRSNKPEEAAEPQAPTRLKVENQAFLDMTIYVYRNSQKIRLGTATGNSTTRFTVPANLIFGATPLRFQADPIGSNRRSISEEITVSPGDEVTLTIPPS